MDFVTGLLAWYAKNKRNLPWRGTKDPYKIWLSEIILQQTRVDQGMAYYHAFTEQYPDVHTLARAPLDKVLKTWEGLGYYSRARNLHLTAGVVSRQLKGKFPQTHAGLLELKGIGDYTASAIASICFNEPEPVVDGNVFRFLSRYFGVRTPIDSTRGKKEFRAIAADLIPEKNPGTFNQAMMEFGARHCTPKNPKCEDCPFRLSCVALKKKLVAQLPVKEKKTKVRDRHLVYLILKNGNYTFISQRTGNDIWKGLFEFPLTEISMSPVLPTKPEVTGNAWKKVVGKIPLRITSVSPPVKHVLSHQNLFVTFVKAEVKGKAAVKNFRRVRIDQLKEFAFPVILKKHLSALF